MSDALVTDAREAELDAPLGIEQLPYAFARRHGLALVTDEEGRTQLWHKPGVPLAIFSEVRRLIGRPMPLRQVDQETLDRQLSLIYESGSKQSSQIMETMGDDIDLDHAARALNQPEDLLESDDDAPIIRLINALFTEAIKEQASDIHIEPYENRLVVRFRVDGVLREVLTPPRTVAPFLVSRIKVMAHLDIAEKRIPQDGRISLKVGNRPVDVRVSTLPSSYGERVVLRLLDKQAGRLDLEQLGMSKSLREMIDPGIIKRPHGIFLVTGPTGSGKTTTLYAALSRLNTQSRNIVTVEDPIEYYLDGIGQTQVNNKVDLTFARGLRAILRQDPDVVMVGEIRDLETAEIAVKAAQTGHLVLSTLHTNDAPQTLTRLANMGIPPFNIASSVLLIMAQRLARRLCEHCKAPDPLPKEALLEEGFTEADIATGFTNFKAVGCDLCNNGYKGRVGIFQVMPVSEKMGKIIMEGGTSIQLEEQATQEGVSNLRKSGLRKVMQGMISLNELNRVTKD